MPLNPALLTRVQYTAENTAVAKSVQDLLPRHVLRFSSRTLCVLRRCRGAIPHTIIRG
jgi:hypothetical protein